MQFVPANKLSSHREKAGCPLVAKSSSDGEFSSGEENRSRADNDSFFVDFFTRQNEKCGKYFKGWSWTIETFFFSSAASLPPFAENKFMQFYRFWMGIEKDQLQLDAGPNKDRGVMSRVLHSSGSQTTKRVSVCTWKHLPKPSKAETKIQIKSLYTFILYSLPTINLCNGIYHFNFRHIGNTLVTVFYSSSFLLLQTLITQPRQPHSFNMLRMFIKPIYTLPPLAISHDALSIPSAKNCITRIVFFSFCVFNEILFDLKFTYSFQRYAFRWNWRPCLGFWLQLLHFCGGRYSPTLSWRCVSTRILIRTDCSSWTLPLLHPRPWTDCQSVQSAHTGALLPWPGCLRYCSDGAGCGGAGGRHLWNHWRHSRWAYSHPDGRTHSGRVTSMTSRRNRWWLVASIRG